MCQNAHDALAIVCAGFAYAQRKTEQKTTHTHT